MKNQAKCPHGKCPQIKFSASMAVLVGGALLLILSFAFSIAAFAASGKAGATPRPTPKANSTASREIVFDGSAVNGRYHSAGEAVARVEAEKNLNELIGPRRNFRDRLALERARLSKTKEVEQ